eukprot:CAMPEP_0183312362 /NCGR_PEP_ID=MMETSP0160_2-20130417/41352_1 /TAXON_ID=2839 ORGANISM="Odontella Sinensis, Strain Grunow 1884" /NCGR_SAMPLE_ID=MMETSP0160_2 /ASSEMBLY_ACC=CAM_ASM_000250 /LENGTH=89 /DNA_ID=CAMNT_0025477197 /DNA_START=76 /DNA_END=342 /DNA_ORIENTATION=+
MTMPLMISDSCHHVCVTEHEAMRRRRKRVVVFIKVLFEILEDEDPALCQRAKEITRQCIRKNRQRDPNYKSLVDSLGRKLRKHISDKYW